MSRTHKTTKTQFKKNKNTATQDKSYTSLSANRAQSRSNSDE